MSQFSICFGSLLAALSAFHPNLAAKSQKETAAPGVQMTIRVYDYVRLSAAEYEPARRHADRSFARAGMDTRWLSCAPTPKETSDPGCKKAITPTDLVLRILPEDMAARVPLNGKVFGYAAVPSGDDGFGTVASIFHHRVAELIAEKRQRVGGRLYSNAVVLGRILAHELGHLMLGRNSHSRSGIMAFPWGPKQLEGCLCGELLFSKAEASTLRREARKRQQASAAK